MSKKSKVSKTKKAQPRVREVPTGVELHMAEAASGIASGKWHNDLLFKQLGIPLAFLTEKEWTEIKKTGGLPDAARFDINAALRRYWHGFIDETIKDGTGKRLNSAIKNIEALLAELNHLDMDEDLTKKNATESEIEALDIVTRTCESLAQCCLVLEKAADRLYKGRGRKGFGPISELISDLDQILNQHVGANLTLSPNRMSHGRHPPSDYVWAVCKIAHPTVTQHTINTRLAGYIAERNSRSSVS